MVPSKTSTMVCCGCFYFPSLRGYILVPALCWPTEVYSSWHTWTSISALPVSTLSSYGWLSLLDHSLAIPNQCLFRPLTVHHHQLVLTQAGNDFLASSSHVPLAQVPNLSNWAIPNSITLRAIFILYKPFIYPSRMHTKVCVWSRSDREMKCKKW